MIDCVVIGARGYTGVELVKILLRHPHVRIRALTTRQKEKVSLRTLIPTLPKDISLEIKSHGFSDLKKMADVVFVCLPHTEAARTVKQFRQAGKIVIDLSADFRLKQSQAYPRWYGHKHPCPQLLGKSVYGLSEIYRDKIRQSDLIANPGCYPTSAILGLWPLLKSRLIDLSSIFIDSKSGVSGAGKKLSPVTQFCEVDENFYAYKVNRHQHTPEIEQALSDVAKKSVVVSFTPHLLPIQRGILTTIYSKRKKGVSAKAVHNAFMKKYENETFVRIKKDGEFPTVQDVKETNFCDIGISVDSRTNRVIVITAIDNLVKGASGQAVQNMNIRLGLPEDEGLRTW